MANKTISAKDKITVAYRLARGASTREAIKGTSIASNNTAARIAQRQSHAIAQYQKTYLELIEQFAGLDAIARARIWAEMANATRYIDRTRVVQAKLVSNEFYRFIANVDDYFVEEVPDWNARYKALRYIDTLAEKVNGMDYRTNNLQINLVKDSSGVEINSVVL